MSTYHNLLGIKYGSTWIPAGTANLNSGITLFNEPSGTAPRSPAYFAVNECKPILSIDTPALKESWDAFGSAFSLNTASALTLYYAAADHGGYDASTVEVLTCPTNQAVIVAKSISASQGAAARMTWDVYGVYSGSNYPFARSTTTLAALVATTTSDVLNKLFTCGQVSDGILRDVTSLSVDFGFQVEQLSCNGAMYPDTVRYRYWAPTATADFTDASYVRTVLMAGSNPVPGVLVNGCYFYFQKCSPTLGRVAASTAEHFGIKFLKQTFIQEAGNPGQWGTVSPTRLMFTAKIDGTVSNASSPWSSAAANVPMTVSTAAKITATGA